MSRYVMERRKSDGAWDEMLSYANPFALAGEFLQETAMYASAHRIADGLRAGGERYGVSQYSGDAVRVRQVPETPPAVPDDPFAGLAESQTSNPTRREKRRQSIERGSDDAGTDRI